ncbi:MAG: GNAT family N-acetyltransferase [Acidobacteriota bacterium]|nr:GNAT family N-acetyltransferase [Acidobacteriota bacterium]
MVAQHHQSLIIRDITEISEMREVEHLQKEVWGVADREVFPALALVPMIEVGGVLLGAFEGGRMAGFVFGFPGRENQKAILHSDMLAVRPEYRCLGLGYRLKLAQRERTLAMGIETITWTFDPLQSRNARLNFGKLGVIANSYRSDYYGATTSFLHQTGTDRLWVTWILKSQRVKDRIQEAGLKRRMDEDAVTALRVGGDNEPLKIKVDAGADAAVFAIEIPEDINRMLTQDAALALRWRAATRDAFTLLLAAGLCVTEFQFVEREYGSVGQYLLTRRNS